MTSNTYIAFFAFIDAVYQNQIHHWNPETKQLEICILFRKFNFKIGQFMTFFDLTMRSNGKITVITVLEDTNHP